MRKRFPFDDAILWRVLASVSNESKRIIDTVTTSPQGRSVTHAIYFREYTEYTWLVRLIIPSWLLTLLYCEWQTARSGFKSVNWHFAANEHIMVQIIITKSIYVIDLKLPHSLHHWSVSKPVLQAILLVQKFKWLTRLSFQLSSLWATYRRMLTHRNRVALICVNKQNHHWFR